MAVNDELMQQEENGRTSVRLGSAQLLEGCVVDERPCWAFATSSGLSAHFALHGDVDSGEDAEGQGTVSIHGFEIAEATVRISARGALIENHFSWGAERFALFLAPERAQDGTLIWHGSATIQEKLPCATTRDFPMQIWLTLEAAAPGVGLTVGTEVEGLAEQAEYRPPAGEAFTAAVAAARISLLGVLKDRLQNAVDELEEQVSVREDGPGFQTVSLAPALAPTIPVPAPPERGYLSGGYLPRTGYLPTTGYLPPSLYSSTSSGYHGYPKMLERTDAEPAPPEEAPELGSETMWRIARLKDLLYAIEQLETPTD
jgi:hypothetical protein